ncbi:MAG TPA: hypothetical protein VF857_11005 [Spirochaetota bacterium]
MRLGTISTYILLFIASMILPTTIKAAAQEDFHARVTALYDFNPCKIDEDTIRKKSSELDGFWISVEANKTTMVPLLRAELKAYKGTGFFLFDGASLLAKISSDKDDLAFVIDAFSRADLCGIDQTELFLRTHLIAQNDVDIWPVMNRIFDYESFSAIMPAKSLTLTQDYCVLYLSIVTDEKYWLDRMIARLATEKSPRSAKALITGIAFSVTEKGQKAIAKAMTEHPDESVRTYAKIFTNLESTDNYKKPDKIVSDRKNLTAYLDSIANENRTGLTFDPDQYAKDIPFLIMKKDYAEIKNARKKVALRFSNEAVDQIFYLSALMQFATTAKE